VKHVGDIGDVRVKVGGGGHEMRPLTHACERGCVNLVPLRSAHGCESRLYRVWLHESYNGPGSWSGWSYCVPPYSYVDIPTAYQATADLYVSSNTSAC